MRQVTWHAPPWVLFLDKGKPHTILPAGRPGEVLDVRGFTRHQANKIIAAANALHDVMFEMRLKVLEKTVQGIVEKTAALAAQRQAEETPMKSEEPK